MAMSACFGGPMLSIPRFQCSLWFRYFAWLGCLWFLYQRDVGAKLSRHNLSNSVGLDRITISYPVVYVNCRPVEQLAYDPNIRNLSRRILCIEYSNERIR